MATPIGIKKQAAIVFIPVRSVTVAEPPKISMEETMMFVAKLYAKKTPLKVELEETSLPKTNSPKKEENEMGKCSPTSTNDLEPGVSVGSIEFKLGGKLMGSLQVRVSAPRFAVPGSMVLTWANSKTWTVAPAPYHHGPEIPYL